VQLEFSGMCFDEHPFSQPDIDFLVNDAKQLIAMENEAIAQGRDPHDLQIDMSRLFRAPPHLGDGRGQGHRKWSEIARRRTVHSDAKVDKLATVVMDIMQNSKVKDKGKVAGKKTKAVDSQGTQKDSRSCMIL
jgi:hypothetical protein